MKLSSAAVKRQLGVILSGSVVGLHTSRHDRLGKKDLIAQLAMDSKVVSALHDLYGQCAEVCPAEKNTYTNFPAVGDIWYVAKFYDKVDESKRAALKGFLDVIVANETFKGQSYSHRRNVSEWASKFKVSTGPDLKEPKPIRGGQWYQNQPTPSDTHTRHQREKQGDALIPSNLSNEQAKGELEGTAHPDAFMTNDALPIIPSIHEAMTDFSNAEPTPDMKWKTSMKGHSVDTDMKIMKNQPTTRTSGYRARGQYLPPVPSYATTTETKLSREEAMVAAADSQQTTGRGNVTSEGQQQLNPTTYMTFGQGTGGKAQPGGVPGTNFLKDPLNSSTTTIPSDSTTAKLENKEIVSDTDKKTTGLTPPEGPTVDSSSAEDSKLMRDINEGIELTKAKTEAPSFVQTVYSGLFKKSDRSLLETNTKWFDSARKAIRSGAENFRRNGKNVVKSKSLANFIQNVGNTGIDLLADLAISGSELAADEKDWEKLFDVINKAIDARIKVLVGVPLEVAKQLKEDLTKENGDISGVKDFIQKNPVPEDQTIGESLQHKGIKMTLLGTSGAKLKKLKKRAEELGKKFGITGNLSEEEWRAWGNIKKYNPELGDTFSDAANKPTRVEELAGKYANPKVHKTSEELAEIESYRKDPDYGPLFMKYAQKSKASYKPDLHSTEATPTAGQQQVEQHDSTPRHLNPVPAFDSSIAGRKSMRGQSSLNPPSLVQTGSTVSHPPKTADDDDQDHQGPVTIHTGGTGDKKIRVDHSAKKSKVKHSLNTIDKLQAEYNDISIQINSAGALLKDEKDEREKMKINANITNLSKKRADIINRLDATKRTFKESFATWASKFVPHARKKKENEDQEEILNRKVYDLDERIKTLDKDIKNGTVRASVGKRDKARLENEKTEAEKQYRRVKENISQSNETMQTLKNEIYDYIGETSRTSSTDAVNLVFDWIEDAEESGHFYTKEEEARLNRKPDEPVAGTPAAVPAVAATGASPMDTTDPDIRVDPSGAGPSFDSGDGLDNKYGPGADKGEIKGGVWTPDRPYQRPPTQPVPFPNLKVPTKPGELGGENQTNTDGSVNSSGRGPGGELKINRTIENTYVPTLRLFFNEGNANIVNEVNNNPTAIKGSRDVWYDMNSYDWETNNEQDNDLHIMNIVDEARRLQGTLDKEELMPKMASEATQESYNKHMKEVFSFPNNQVIDAASIMLDVRGGAPLTPLNEDETMNTFHDVYLPAWISIPESSPWKRFTQINGTQISDSYLRDPTKFSGNDAFFDRNENAFIYTTDT